MSDGQWFSGGGAQYAQSRPTYPVELATTLAALAPRRRLAVDIGCGTGQLTVLLAEHFDTVIGIDPSADQLAHATAAPGVEYRCAAAEDPGLDDGSADLITVAQAAHWLDLPAFYEQVRRIAAADAVLALITYGRVVLDDEAVGGALADRFARFYRDEVGPYWPPERVHVDNGYASLVFPFTPIPVDAPSIRRNWTLDEFAAYLRTWSAARAAERAGAPSLIDALVDDLRPHWGSADRRREVQWPVTVLAGLVNWAPQG